MAANWGGDSDCGKDEEAEKKKKESELEIREKAPRVCLRSGNGEKEEGLRQ